MWTFFRTLQYVDDVRHANAFEQERIKGFEQQLKQEPHQGKPLRYHFLREKKLGGKRLIFLVYEEHQAVFLVALVDKKLQQATINQVVRDLVRYRERIRTLLRDRRGHP